MADGGSARYSLFDNHFTKQDVTLTDLLLIDLDGIIRFASLFDGCGKSAADIPKHFRINGTGTHPSSIRYAK
jgi:hypothetical protein